MRSRWWAPVAVSVLLAGMGCGPAVQDNRELSPEELSTLLEKPGRVFFLDVREPYEIEFLGSVEGYVNIPLSQLEGRLKEIPRGKPVVTL
jgi:rhodanese-related sulfurtransferase